MRFSIASVFALATAVMAQTEGFNVITKPVKGEQVPAGSTYEIVWQPSAAHPGEITIGLLGGASPQTLSVVDTIATAVDGEAGTYSWSVPSTLGDLATYGIMITLESDKSVFQYGFPFQIVADGSGSSSSAEATATATPTDSETSETATSSTKASTKSAKTSVTSTTFSVPSSTIVSSTIKGNLSTTVSPSSTITTSVISETATETETATSSIATNGVASLAAGSFAMLGGVAMAVLAL
ncbi:Ser-Thr-rich glycosyl-phosphatidyl-inositol-anchored membrane family-domain-containing protein [Chaetomium sp. MPI-CAGE-AT-0009]|nr:Ser-Thr-rich glycosyl-phosphatidyl-inositol-anchored membrane family-domain-containing protein [Chaetomium sp. MPI-CAGE-AT-0009]